MELKEIEGKSTAELISLLDSKTDDADYDCIWDVVKDRDIVKYFQDQIEELSSQIDGQQVAIDKLKRHTHDPQGKPVVNL